MPGTWNAMTDYLVKEHPLLLRIFDIPYKRLLLNVLSLNMSELVVQYLSGNVTITLKE